MQTNETNELFENLRKALGTYTEVAKALDLPERTFFDWRNRGFANERKWKIPIARLKMLLNLHDQNGLRN